MKSLQLDFNPEPNPDDRKLRGYCCPECNQLVKTYRRHFNSNMALALMFLYHQREKGFIKLEKEMKERGYDRCGDAAYLRHYRLIEPLDKARADVSKRNGFYKINSFGILFCEQKSTVNEFFLIFNNKLEGFDGSLIDIKQALGEKFDYGKLMIAI